jgi:hypothetical protein
MADPTTVDGVLQIANRFAPLKALSLRVVRSRRVRALSMRVVEVITLGPCGPLIMRAVRVAVPWGQRLLMGPGAETMEALEALGDFLAGHQAGSVFLVVLLLNRFCSCSLLPKCVWKITRITRKATK